MSRAPRERRNPTRLGRAARYTWAAPTSAFGLTVGVLTLATRGRAQVRRGVIEFHGGFASWLADRFGFAAMTLGHVIIGCDPLSLDRCRDHEHVHVRQVERWGPFFLPAYVVAGVWSWCRTRSAYYENPFEREAFGEDARRRRGPTA